MRSCIGFVFCVVASLLLCTLKVQAQKVRGTPGVDYPNYPSIPQTSFKCSEQKYIPGFYADLETDCQVFHFCFDNRHESFLCPTGTTFNQPILACDMWYSSNCSLSPLFYVVNAGPAIESAGKKIPMLLKLRDRAKDGFTTMASVSSVFEKLSALNGESVQQETNEVSEEGTATVTIDNVQLEAKDVGNVPEINYKKYETNKLESSISDTQGDQSTAHLKVNDKESLSNVLDSSNENFGEFQEELNNESNMEDLIYDPVTDGYYMQDYSSDIELPAESEPNSQFQSFYDFRNFDDQIIQEGDSVQFQDSNEDETYTNEDEFSEVQNEDAPENFQLDRNDIGQEYYDENSFYKRLQTIQIPKRSRRKPTYIVVDQPDVRFQTRQRQGLYPVLEQTESPYDESISIDSVVEESSTEFIEYSDAADENEEFESDKDLKESYDEATESDISDFENAYSEDSNLSSKPSESDLGLSDYQAEDDSETSESAYDKFSDSEDRSINIGNYLTEEKESDSTAENKQDSVNKIDAEGDESDEDITIYDDSYDPEVYGSERNKGSDVSMEEQDTVVIIPDETDFPTTSENDAMGSSIDNVEYESEDLSNNWQYVYSKTGEIPQNTDSDGRYMYEDSEGNEQGTDEIGNSEGIYDPSEYAQQNYAYPGTYGENYPRYQPPDYDFISQDQNYIPGNYFQYTPEDRESLSEQEPSEVSYETSEDGGSDSEENLDSSEFDSKYRDFSRGSPNVPSNLYSYASPDGQSYGYNYIYPQMQNGYMNDYSYSPQYGYSYENVDGSLYSNEGDESLSSIESEYVTESSDAGLPLAPEYEGLQETWAGTDFEAENSEEIGEEESEENGSQEFETQDGYTLSYELSSESPNVDFNMQDTESKFENFQGSRQNEETYYVLEDEDTDGPSNFDVQETAEEIEAVSNETDVDRQTPMSSDSRFDHKDFIEKDILDKIEPSKAVNVPGVVYSDSESMLNIPHGEGKIEGVVMSELGIKTDSMLNSRPSHTFNSDKENDKPAVLSTARERLAVMKQAEVSPSSRDFMAATETQFLNSVPFPNTMDFSPYGFGSNMGQQFAMMDSSNLAPFSKIENSIPSETLNSGISRLSKLSSLQDKVRSMKRGRFGMFKKYMNSMKNYKE